MKKIFFTLHIILTCLLGYSQSIGVQGGNILRVDKLFTNAFGFGMVFSSNHKSEKVSLLVSPNLYVSNRTFNNGGCIGSEFKLSYRHFASIVAGLYQVQPKAQIQLKAGAAVGYDYIDLSETGIGSNWLCSGKYQFISAGLLFMGSYRFNESPFSLFLMVNPMYSFTVSTESPTGLPPEMPDLISTRTGVGMLFNLQ